MDICFRETRSVSYKNFVLRLVKYTALQIVTVENFYKE